MVTTFLQPCDLLVHGCIQEQSLETAIIATACPKAEGYRKRKTWSRHSYRRISIGRMREAARAGKSVAATLMKSAAAAIQSASKPFE